MSQPQITCPVCGWRFDPGAGQACSSCPLNRGCRLICCPRCGHSTIDPNATHVGRGLMRLVGRHRPGRGGRRASRSSGDARSGSGWPKPQPRVRLCDLPSGGRARICCFSDQLTARRRELLMAYGVRPGEWLRVCRTSPVTVIEIDQLELALDHDLAHTIQVDQLELPESPKG